ncbi:MAG: hypothetical protein AUH85_01935 [Chloroflexi bacterium 13_1_40CM_4_68_4]|nr:MAG: hypothetical protein AUH85_01935 [Chloroflexi bacterium 13_1_40CM_4_68_4]
MATTSTPRRTAVRWSAADDAALDAILSLERIWGEKGGHVTLADLGLDARLRVLSIAANCIAHGNFAREWVGCLGELLPEEIACDLHGLDGRACGMPSRVRSAEIH